MRRDAVQVEAAVVGLTHDGQGIADLDGERVFVSGVLPGERAILSLQRRRRRYREATLVELLDPAADRVEPPCPHFGRCGGCAVQHLSYSAQVRFKEVVVRDALERIAGIEIPEWLPALTGAEWNYRRRARLGVRYVEAKGRVLVGFKERASRLVTDMSRCPVLVEPMDAVPGLLGSVVTETSLRQKLPQAEIAVGDNARALVLRVLEEPTEADLARFGALGAELETDVYLQRAGPGSVRALEPERAHTLSYRLDAFGVDLRFAPTDFIQVNGPINAAMVGRVVERLQLTGKDRVLDLYCGLGNFSLPIARHAATVLGVEGEAGLVARAASNAALNEITNARFVTADLSLPDWPFLRESWDVVVLDPPRSGAQAAVSLMGRMNPRRIAYVSCHPATLARDAKELISGRRYRLIAAGIADMFPHTHHVEAVAIFDRCRP
jgi:23S rRNA (uracil1939-C5)-methyltransferase